MHPLVCHALAGALLVALSVMYLVVCLFDAETAVSMTVPALIAVIGFLAAEGWAMWRKP